MAHPSHDVLYRTITAHQLLVQRHHNTPTVPGAVPSLNIKHTRYRAITSHQPYQVQGHHYAPTHQVQKHHSTPTVPGAVPSLHIKHTRYRAITSHQPYQVQGHHYAPTHQVQGHHSTPTTPTPCTANQTYQVQGHHSTPTTLDTGPSLHNNRTMVVGYDYRECTAHLCHLYPSPLSVQHTHHII